MPPGKPGRLRNTHAPSTTRVRSEPVPLSSCALSSSVHEPRPSGASCQSSSVSSATAAVTRARSSSSVKKAPWLQQPSSGRPSTTPAQPRPKMHVQAEVSQVRSARTTWPGSAGSTNSTHSREKSSGTSANGSSGTTPA